MVKPGFYAVGNGRQIGIYNTWAECEANVKGFPNAKFKKFATQSLAQAFIAECGKAGCSVSTTTAPKVLIPQNGSSSSFGNYRNAQPSPATPTTSGVNKRKFCSSPSTPGDKDGTPSAKRTPGRRTQLLDTPLPKYLSKKLRLDSPNIKGLESYDGEKEYLPFLMDEEGYVNVYTDGACLGNGKTRAKAGVGVWFGDDHPMNISEPVEGPPTNNNAEIQAARLAIEAAESAGFAKLRINTDSAFLIDCVLKFVPKWRRNGWKLANGKDVKNQRELQKLDACQQTVLVMWTKVPAHSGVHGNEMADRLANEGALQYVRQ